MIFPLVVLALVLVSVSAEGSQYLWEDSQMGIYNVTNCSGAPKCGKRPSACSAAVC